MLTRSPAPRVRHRRRRVAGGPAAAAIVSAAHPARDTSIPPDVRNFRPVVFAALTIALVGAAVVWTVASASALSMTFDEPHHLATGLEWWQFGDVPLVDREPAAAQGADRARPVPGGRAPARPHRDA